MIERRAHVTELAAPDEAYGPYRHLQQMPYQQEDENHPHRPQVVIKSSGARASADLLGEESDTQADHREFNQ